MTGFCTRDPEVFWVAGWHPWAESWGRWGLPDSGWIGHSMVVAFLSLFLSDYYHKHIATKQTLRKGKNPTLFLSTSF